MSILNANRPPDATGSLTRQDPPPALHGLSPFAPKWVTKLAAARGAPQTWFRLDGEYAKSTATHIKQGYFKGIEPGEFEATSRAGSSPDRRVVYVRYVGGAA